MDTDHVTSKELPGLEFINEIILTTLHTAWISRAIPISLLIVAPSGAGKSKTLLRYEGPSIHRTDDLTSSGLFELLKHDIDNKIRFILMGDFNPVLSHRSSVTNLTVASMLSVMSDGTMRIDDGRESKEVRHSPVGFITACTNEMYMHNHKKWQALGIIRRFLTINYKYSIKTELEGVEAISRREVTFQQLRSQFVQAKPEKDIRIPEDISNKLIASAGDLAEHMGYRIQIEKDKETMQWRRRAMPGPRMLKFTPLLILQEMAQAHAYKELRTAVTDKDFAFITNLLSFTNPAMPGLI